MLGQQSNELYQRRLGREALPVDLHNRHPHDPDDSSEHVGDGPTAVASTETSSRSEEPGQWGERDIGGPVSQIVAMEDYEDMQRELSRLGRTQSSATGRTARTHLHRSWTGKSESRSKRGKDCNEEKDPEAGTEGSVAGDDEEEFELGKFIEAGHLEKRTAEGHSARKVGVVFKNLTVKGTGSQSSFVKTLPDAVLGTFGPDLYRFATRFIPALSFGAPAPTRDLIRDFSGVVRDGEMLLVLGRPGSGCSTFLKAIANMRKSFALVLGDISYGGISAEEQNKHYRGEVTYNPETDQHLPQLNVWQTLQFSLLSKTRKRFEGEIELIINALLRMFAITHTKDTLVGDEYIRGVSGGERKRVSIAETLITKSTVTCWDNSTRGLDASTALDFAKSLRIMTDVSKRTTLTTLYQAGQDIYELFDKVLVIEEGRMLFQGPVGDAKKYFIDLGFHCPDRQTTSDFLTSLTDPNERQFGDGMEAQCPKTPEELEAAFRASDHYKKVLADVSDYEAHLHRTQHADAKRFQQSITEHKSKTVSKKSPYTISYFRQILACTRREWWLLWGDKTSLYTKFFIIASNCLIVGSLFYGQPNTTASAFSRGGTVFFSITFLGWLQLSELMKAVSGRTVITRHQEYAFYRPSAVSVARVIVDFPVLLAEALVFGVIMYFMTGLRLDAGAFFIFLLFVYVTTICITGLYRMLAAFSSTIDDAVRFASMALNLIVIFAGYMIPKTQLLSKYIWFGWIYHINPFSYSFEAVLSNEIAGRDMPCDPSMLVPQGPGVLPEYQGCAISGAQMGSTTVTGEQYLETSLQYTHAHLWRNFGVLLAFSILYVLVTAIASETFSFATGGGGALTFKRSKNSKKQVAVRVADEEKAGKPEDNSSGINRRLQREITQEQALRELSKSESIFTWSGVRYTVPLANGGQRELLHGVSGYVKPGVLVALMGASGAGKTTLLNTLSQRQKVGVVSGEMLVDGRVLGTEFQRSTGFVEQMDLHDETATIREALEFSALLRQDRTIPRKEKLDYVDKIITLLELDDVQDAIVASLGVEQKKRLTIGVELAAKPSLLLFLDEPTSGLDSQSAFSIVRFLKKLAAAGQAIICTIHQPSSMLIQQFDMILALNPGGNTFYFGPVGDNGSAVVNYFAARGVHCPPHKNVAEFILETAIKGGKREDGKKLDWNKEWQDSRENKELLNEIDRIRAERNQVQTQLQVVQYEFAASTWSQTTLLTKRMFTQYWRDPSYYYGKLFVSVIIGIFNGFTFWKLGNGVTDMQDRMFTSFMIIFIPACILNSVVPKFYQNRALWEAREYPSKTYGWVAFCTANVVTEIPAAIIGGIVYWILWYWATGLPTDSSTSGYVFLMTVLFFLFQASWGQWICAFAPSFTVISNVLPFFLVMFVLFNGVVRPYSQLPVFWRYWMYYLNPSQWWIAGVIAATLANQSVQCTASEFAYFNPPPGQTCGSYAGAFVRATGMGYLQDITATSNCGYCPYSNGVEYMRTLNVQPSDKWRNFGIFLAFCISNWALVYFFIYTVRVRGWTFGFGPLFGGLEKGVSRMKRLVTKKR